MKLLTKFARASAVPAVALSMILVSSPALAEPTTPSSSSFADPSLYIDVDSSASGSQILSKTNPDQSSPDSVKLSGSNYSITCTGMNGTAVNNPHYSKGAGGAIYKTTIQCQGYGRTSVPVRVQGLLSFDPASSWNEVAGTFYTRAKSDQVQWVSVNGPAKTFYTPKVGSNGGTGMGYWRATSTWYFDVDGRNSTVGSQTKTVFKKIFAP